MESLIERGLVCADTQHGRRQLWYFGASWYQHTLERDAATPAELAELEERWLRCDSCGSRVFVPRPWKKVGEAR